MNIMQSMDYCFSLTLLVGMQISWIFYSWSANPNLFVIRFTEWKTLKYNLSYIYIQYTLYILVFASKNVENTVLTEILRPNGRSYICDIILIRVYIKSFNGRTLQKTIYSFHFRDWVWKLHKLIIDYVILLPKKEKTQIIHNYNGNKKKIY